MNKKGMIRRAAFLTVIVAIFFLVQFVAGLGGTGTQGDPYQITNCTDLNETRNDLAAYYTLTNDVNCSDTLNWNAGAGFNPIGTLFTGNFDGQNYTIDQLYINRSITNLIGLFARLNGGTVSNLDLTAADITGSSSVGVLAGHAYATSNINNVHTTGSVSGVWRVGGLIGRFADSTINNSGAAVTVAGTSDSVGGFIGYANVANIDNSYATGSVTGVNYVGGLVGYNYDYSNIDNSYATGAVSGTNYIGGLVGYNKYYATVDNSYATGSVSGTKAVGGLVGYNYYGSTIDNSYAVGNVSGTSLLGGLVGDSTDSPIVDSFATGAVTGAGANVGGLVGYTNYAVTGSYWHNDTSDDADRCIASNVGTPTDCTGNAAGSVGVVYNISYFFDWLNLPMDNWDYSIWSNFCNLNGYSPLTWQGISSLANCLGYTASPVTPPTAIAATPANSQLFLSSNTTFAFYASSVYNSTLGYNLTLDGVVNQTGTVTNGTNKSIMISGLSNGNHTWSVTVWDSNGANTTATKTFVILTRVDLTPIVLVPIVNTSNSSGLMDLATYGVPASIINLTGVTGYEYVITTNGSTPTVNLSVSVFIEAPTNTTDISSVSTAVSGFYYQIAVNDSTWFANVTNIQLRMYYDISTITLPSGVAESSLRPLRYTSGTWTRLDCAALGGCTATLSDGTELFAAGVNTTGGYVWANLSKFSTYGIGGAATTPPSSSSGGGGGSSTFAVTGVEKEKNVYESYSLRFRAVGSSVDYYQYHNLKIDSLDDGSVSFTISSTPQSYTLNVNETAKVDLDDDDIYDLEVTLLSMNSLKARFSFLRIEEEVPEIVPEPVEVVEVVPEVEEVVVPEVEEVVAEVVPEVEEVVVPEVEEVEPEPIPQDVPLWLWLVLGCAIIVVIAGYFVVKKR